MSALMPPDQLDAAQLTMGPPLFPVSVSLARARVLGCDWPGKKKNSCWFFLHSRVGYMYISVLCVLFTCGVVAAVPEGGGCGEASAGRDVVSTAVRGWHAIPSFARARFYRLPHS